MPPCSLAIVLWRAPLPALAGTDAVVGACSGGLCSSPNGTEPTHAPLLAVAAMLWWLQTRRREKSQGRKDRREQRDSQ